MADYVVLKRLTEKSDLGWFRSIFYNRSLKGRQKGITLNKAVINDIWPNLVARQIAYEAAKAAEAPKKTLPKNFRHLTVLAQECFLCLTLKSRTLLYYMSIYFDGP